MRTVLGVKRVATGDFPFWTARGGERNRTIGSGATITA
jgi:hypothetical protein